MDTAVCDYIVHPYHRPDEMPVPVSRISPNVIGHPLLSFTSGAAAARDTAVWKSTLDSDHRSDEEPVPVRVPVMPDLMELA